MENIFEKNKTYLGDCLELMPQMEGGMFDMILCDLPYGTTACKWDTIIPFELLWKEYERLIKPNGAIVLFGSEPFSSYQRMSNIKLYRYDWIWEKNKTSNYQLAKKMPLKNHETISVFYKNLPTYNPQKEWVGIKDKRTTFNPCNHTKMAHIASGITYCKKDDGTRYPKTVLKFDVHDRMNLIHNTQKPVPLYEYLIRTYTNEGELILDNCAGSGTTAEACFNTGRNYIQIEKEQKYFDLILGREKSFNKKDNEAQTSLWNTANGI